MSTPVTVHHGNSLEVLRTLPDASVDAIVTDPPYGLEFMGKEWDGADGFRRSLNAADAGRDNAFGRTSRTSPEYRTDSKATAGMSRTPKCRVCDKWQRGGNPCTCEAPDFPNERLPRLHSFQEWCEAWARECLRVLKPGGHMLAFGGTRTWHRLACAVEDAGFEVRDSIAWLYGSGFAKSWNFKTQFGGAWCECEGGNALPYDHADNADLSRVRGDVHPPAVARREGDVLLAQVQRSGAGSGVGEARPQGSRGMVAGVRDAGSRSDARREEPRLEGRDVHRAGQGLSDGADAESPASTGEWLRGRAPAGDGVADRAGGDASRGGASHQRGPSGQSAGEPKALHGSHGPLDDGALRDGPVCARCGGLDPFYRGAGSALKPAHEPIVVARKPLSGTLASTVLAHGTGALNIDGCRVAGDDNLVRPAIRRDDNDVLGKGLGVGAQDNPAGRWPANVILDESQAAALDEQSGETVSSNRPRHNTAEAHNRTASMGSTNADWTTGGHDDQGGASRFFFVADHEPGEHPDECPDCEWETHHEPDQPFVPFDQMGERFRYVAKADSSERVRVNGTAHPTVKPLALMRWLVRLVTPPGGTVLEPFAGSGTTVEACILEGFSCIAIEREADYLPLIRQRIARRRDPVAAVKAAADDGGLFDLLDDGGAA